MAKEREKVELKPVDEEAEKVNRLVRLHADAIEEVEDLPPVRLGVGDEPEEPLVAPTKDELKMRTTDPGVGSLIEMGDIQAHEDKWSDPIASKIRISLVWFALVGCIFLGAILWSLVSMNQGEEKRIVLVDEAENIIEKEMREETDAEEVVVAIEKAVREFFGAGSVEEMLRHVRQPQRVAPLMKRYYGESPPISQRVERMLVLDPLTIHSRADFWKVTCEFKGGVKRQVVVEATADNTAKIDWETFVCYQPMDWNVFARTRPGGYTGDFRVYVKPDIHYTFEFADSSKYNSFRLTTLNGEESLYGYVERNTEIEKKMLGAIRRNGGGETPMILRLHLPDGFASKRGVVVKEMVNSMWLILDNPEEGKE